MLASPTFALGANLEALSCSFCNKSQSEIAKLVAGPGVYICNECVDLCNQIITRELDRKGAQAPEAAGQLGPRIRRRSREINKCPQR